MVPVVNPNGRKKVEEGFNCWRSNGNKIDPNRNWEYNHHYLLVGEAFWQNP